MKSGRVTEGSRVEESNIERELESGELKKVWRIEDEC